MTVKSFTLALLGLLVITSCNKSEKDPHHHFAGKRKEPSGGPNLVFYDLTQGDTVLVGDSVNFDYRFNNNGFQTARMNQVENLSAYCKCEWPDSVKAGKIGMIRAKCAFDSPGYFKGLFKVTYKGGSQPITLTFGCEALPKK